MGTVLFRIDKHENDPNNVMIPPNLGGFNRVIISLPPNTCTQLSIDDILTDLVDYGFLNGIEEHDTIEDNHYVIRRANESEVNELMNYINNKFGYVAEKGYVKPSRNIIINNNNKFGATTTDVAKSAHIALIQSPIGINPNDQFSAFRREFDAETEFPKFERVDIEEIIHYTRNDKAMPKKNANVNLSDMNNRAKNALDAMTKGVEFDITETLVVKDREAVKIDYCQKVRQLRMQMSQSKLRRMKSERNRKRISAQFKYDHMNALIGLKQKKYGINRTKAIYGKQREQRLRMAAMKQRLDPNIKETEYNKHQSMFWQTFDYSTK